jgi:uncharacterized membrane protein YfcA
MQFPQLAGVQWVGASLAALLVGISKSGFGAGAGILAVPLMAAALGPAGMLPAMLLLLLAGDVLGVRQYASDHDGRDLAFLLPGLAAGVALGSALLSWFLALPDAKLWLRRVIGVLAIAFVTVQAALLDRPGGRAGGRPVYRPRLWHGVGIGACAGITSTLAHTGGPFVALFLLPQMLGRRVFVGTILKFFFAANLLKLAPYARQGLLTAQAVFTARPLLPLVAAGALAGAALNRRLSDSRFRLVVYLLTLLSGVWLVAGLGVSRTVRGPDGGGRAGFDAAMACYGAGDYDGAAAGFAPLASGGSLPAMAARLNWGVALYGAGRYAEAGRVLAPVQGCGDPVLAARALYNRGNCAYRCGHAGEAAVQYLAALRVCRGAMPSRGARAATRVLWEVRRRAQANLALALAGPAEARQAEAVGSAAAAARREPERAAETRSAGATAGEDAGRPGHGAPGGPSGESARSVEELLRSVLSSDTGPAMGHGSPARARQAADW